MGSSRSRRSPLAAISILSPYRRSSLSASNLRMRFTTTITSRSSLTDITGFPVGRRCTPFILVVAQDVNHARTLHQLIESEEFFKGRFKDKVVEVHSAQTGQESEEALARLVALETDPRTEIVIHVNKLKEGWDVTNLYTIVPLRASASEILTEQTLGRGLRLPYGARVAKGEFAEFAAVDRLTVIAHDRFDEVIKRAREPGSVVQMQSIIIGEGGDVSLTGTVLVETPSELLLTGAYPDIPGLSETPQEKYIFRSPEEIKTAQVALQVMERFERRVGSVEGLLAEDVQQRIASEVTELTRPLQGELEQITKPADIQKVVAAVTKTVVENTISIPKMVVLPKKQVTFHFDDFSLRSLESINYRPISDELLIENLRTGVRSFLARAIGGQLEMRQEDYIVRHLVERNEIDYDAHADLLYKLAGEIVQRVHSYLVSDAETENVLLSHGGELAEFVYAQMMEHYRETPLGEEDYEVRVTHGFTRLKPQHFTVPSGRGVRSFKQAIAPLSETKRHIFGGFERCCYPIQRFESDPERRFAVLIDGEPTVEKWMKPGKAQFQIEHHSQEAYEPDFVVETKTNMLICEVKARAELDDPTVQAKATAAVKWCQAATGHARADGGKSWHYLLIPDDQILANATLDGLAARSSRT
jgi:type III restriction enzyme